MVMSYVNRADQFMLLGVGIPAAGCQRHIHYLIPSNPISLTDCHLDYPSF